MVRSRYYNHSGPPTYEHLDEIATVLAGVKQSFWPFLNGAGANTKPYGSGNDAGQLVINASTLELIFDPIPLPGGIYAYQNDSATANLAAADSTEYSHGNGTVDTPFSVGVWILMQEALGTARSILAKFGTTAVDSEEWDFRLGTDGKLVLELHDATASTTEIATSAGTALTPFKWQFCVATYDGGETDPVINLYLNAVSVHTGASVESGAYVAMDNTASVLMLGSRDAVATAAQVFQGAMALPFVVGKELTSAEVSRLYRLGRLLIGA